MPFVSATADRKELTVTYVDDKGKSPFARVEAGRGEITTWGISAKRLLPADMEQLVMMVCDPFSQIMKPGGRQRKHCLLAQHTAARALRMR